MPLFGEHADRFSQHWVEVFNTTSGAIPAFGAMRVVGTRVRNNRLVFEVDTPNTSPMQTILFNGPEQIVTSTSSTTGYGRGSASNVVTAAYDSGSARGAPEREEEWYVQDGSHSLGDFGFVSYSVLGGVDTTNNVMVVGNSKPQIQLMGKTTQNHPKGTTAPVDVYYSPEVAEGSASDQSASMITDVQVPVWNPFADVDNKAVVMFHFVDGVWTMGAAEC